MKVSYVDGIEICAELLCCKLNLLHDCCYIFGKIFLLQYAKLLFQNSSLSILYLKNDIAFD